MLLGRDKSQVSFKMVVVLGDHLPSSLGLSRCAHPMQKALVGRDAEDSGGELPIPIKHIANLTDIKRVMARAIC